MLITDYPLIDDYDNHKATGRLGGDDYRVSANGAVIVGEVGYATIANGIVTINRADKSKIQVLHLARTTNINRTNINVDTIIGYAQGRGGKSPHIHELTPSGVRRRYKRQRQLSPVVSNATLIKPVKNRVNMFIKLWLYTSSNPDQWVIIDHFNKVYRLVPKGSVEAAGIANDVNAGVLRYDVIADPEWGKEFGNGQFKNIS